MAGDGTSWKERVNNYSAYYTAMRLSGQKTSNNAKRKLLQSCLFSRKCNQQLLSLIKKRHRNKVCISSNSNNNDVYPPKCLLKHITSKNLWYKCIATSYIQNLCCNLSNTQYVSENKIRYPKMLYLDITSKMSVTIKTNIQNVHNNLVLYLKYLFYLHIITRFVIFSSNDKFQVGNQQLPVGRNRVHKFRIFRDRLPYHLQILIDFWSVKSISYLIHQQ